MGARTPGRLASPMLNPQGMKLCDIMRPGPSTIADSDSLGAALRAMQRDRVRYLPVLRAGELVGILSERDILAARGWLEPGADWWTIEVRNAMHAPPQTATPDDSVAETVARMASANIGALPVVERGILLGIVSMTDVLDAEVRTAVPPRPASLATAADAMTPMPFTIDPDALLVDAIASMVEHHVRHLPVTDSNRSLVGMLSERDVRTAIGDPVVYLEQASRSPAQHRVRDVMMKPAVSVAFDRPLVDIARLFADGQIEAVAVTDEAGALVGIISYVDALRVLAR